MSGGCILDLSIGTILICSLLQGCESQKCKQYEDSGIQKGCVQLSIANGDVCYTSFWIFEWLPYKWEAEITCHSGFELTGSSNKICKYTFSTGWAWRDPTLDSKCVPEISTTKSTSTTSQSNIVSTSKHTSSDKFGNDEQDGSNLAVYVTIPTVFVLLIVIVIIIIVYIYRRRKMSEKEDTIHRSQSSMMTNPAYGDTVDDSGVDPRPSGNAEGIGTEYVYIRDSNIPPIDIVESEYNTIHTETNKAISTNYNHVPIHQDDQYDHTANIAGNIGKEADTYSHLNNVKNERTYTGLNTELGNVYNKVDGQRLEMDMNDEDPSYDHTNVHPGELAKIELDTYAEVDNGLGITHENSPQCQEDHEYFVLEKN